jgi:imidazolonepropionase-like amidohydrolase
LFAFLATRAFAQSWLLTGATVHTVSGETFSPGQVLIRDSQIAAVGETLSADGASNIDLSGLQLYPGLIALNTGLGLTEIEAVRATRDATETGDYTPDVQSWVAVNPDSELIPVARANGIAAFEPVPQGGIVSGFSALMSVEGWTTEQMVLRQPIALHLFWPKVDLDVPPKPAGPAKAKSLDEQAKERSAKLRALADFFDEARAYAQAKDASAKGAAPAPNIVPAWEAMLPCVRGQVPIVVHADDLRQIRAAVEWADTNGFKIILAGGRDAFRVAGLLAAKKIPVIYSHTFTRPARDTESYDVHFTAPEVLRKAGVTVVFSLSPSAWDATMIRNLPYSAAQAVAFGFPAEEALKALTLYPARLAGVADRLGSIEPGKQATLFAADGDILDLRANVKRMWIAGQEVSLDSRHTKLYQKYKNRPRPVASP